MANHSLDNSLLKVPISTGFRRLFYIVKPSESSFAKEAEVPNYVDEAIPFFFTLIILENCLNWWHGKKTWRINDAVSSVSSGMVSQLPLLFGRSIEVAAYCYVYHNFRIKELDWNCATTWWIAAIVVDCGYYWFHRAAHEINLFWAGHQVHHSSQDYNLATALRQSILQRYTSWMFYLPMALFVPPQVFMVHIQFNLLYQFWIHTELVENLGPLEYIFNTPSHHRVHHGRNPYCIDKNYAGTLIIWDRMFGTFQPETEQVEYGLVHPLQTWNPIEIQICHLKWIWQRFNEEKTISDKLSALFKGPGWQRGTPRLGNHEDLPEVEYPVKCYDSSISPMYSIYILVHFLILNITYTEMVQFRAGLTPVQVTLAIVFILFSLTTFGCLNDRRSYAPYLETVRLLVLLGLFFHFDPENNLPSNTGIYFDEKLKAKTA
ncbi:DgyrCDS12776 [Dimorphilus gyrociliatus]|uniref:Alkylglycerol monooxygenase n=1 Tax=Dimorphilus gyrociliatus TaxID=2664684 RepID=A0A7I8W8Q8_9ANNE|nr:DgyrCDS12776 [Dimorphilus gyrociliatus]